MILLYLVFVVPPAVISKEPDVCGQQIVDRLYHPTQALPLVYDHLLLVSEQRGTITGINLKSGERQDVLDLRDRILTSTDEFEERGLLSFAINPKQALTGQEIFLCYSTKDPSNSFDHQLIVSSFELTVFENETIFVEPRSELVRLVIPQPGARENGGYIFFDAQGYLYVTVGSGGLRHQETTRYDLSNLLGKILRLDISKLPYRIPTSNPFFGTSENHREEIFAYGFKNPWRCGISPSNHYDEKIKENIICGDLGFGSQNIDEISLVEKSGRYGWMTLDEAPCKTLETCIQMREENQLPGDYKVPIYIHKHASGQAVIGGNIYSGQEIPSLHGTYVYGDFIHGSLHYLRRKGDETWDIGDIKMKQKNIEQPYYILAFSADLKGEILVLGITSLSNEEPSGFIMKIRPSQYCQNHTTIVDGLPGGDAGRMIELSKMAVILVAFNHFRMLPI